ncbi:MAG: hypothetical protein AB1422_03600 [bacterium]
MGKVKNIEDNNLFKKVIYVISLAFVLIILNSYSQEIGALRTTGENISNHILKNEENTIPIYISKFWKKLTVDEIPNNGEKYNCTATIQMLYAVWFKKLSTELGYTSVNEMLDYSLRVTRVKEIMDTTIQSWNQTPDIFPEVSPEIYQILNSSWYGKLGEYDAIDKFLIEIGLIDDSDWKSSTWEVVELMLNNGYALYQKQDPTGKKAIDFWKEKKDYLPLDENAINLVLPGDILTGKYYATHYPEKYTTHLTVYLGIRTGTHSFAEQFGDETRIVSLEKMYKALRTGFEAIFRPVIIISPDKTQEFLTKKPFAEYNFGTTRPRLLFFKEEAKNFLLPIQVTVNGNRSQV